MLTCAAVELDPCSAQTLHELDMCASMPIVGWSSAAHADRPYIAHAGSSQVVYFPLGRKIFDFGHFTMAPSDQLAAPGLRLLVARYLDSRLSGSNGVAGCGNDGCESAGICIFRVSAESVVKGRKCEKCAKEVLNSSECVFMHMCMYPNRLETSEPDSTFSSEV